MFSEVRNNLSRYVGTKIRKYASVAAMAMSELKTHVFDALVRPEKIYQLDKGGNPVKPIVVVGYPIDY